MLRSRRLQVVLAVEERKEQAALERLTEARERMQQHLEQVQNLQRYQQEYQAQMHQGREGPVSAARLQSWQAFVSQLDAVIQQQQRLLDQAERQFENCRQDWLRAWERRRIWTSSAPGFPAAWTASARRRRLPPASMWCSSP